MFTRFHSLIIPLIGLMFCYSSIGFWLSERVVNKDLSWLDAAWWAVVTMTTVGYGDLAPSTDMGRIIVGYPTMIFGVSLLGYMLSSLASWLVELKRKERIGMNELHIKDHIIICRYGGTDKLLKVVNELKKDIASQDVDIVLIDEGLVELPVELQEKRVLFIKGDPSREAVLERANYKQAKYLIILADEQDYAHSDNISLKIVLLVEQTVPNIYSVVECVLPENRDFFMRAGCDSVVCVSALASQLIVQEILDPGVQQMVSELTSNRCGKQFYLVPIPDEAKSYHQVKDLLNTDETLVMGIRRENDNLFVPSDSTPITSNDRAILIADRRPS